MTLMLTVIGCSGSYPAPGRPCSGYLLRSPEATVLVDLGPGVLGELQRHIGLGELDALVLTHEHPDHWVETPSLGVAMKYYLGLDGLPVYGTAGTRDMAQTIIGDIESTLRWTVISPSSQVRLGDLSLTFARTDHPVETLAVRVDQDAETGGGSLAYTADTGPDWPAEELATGVDLLLSEATIPVTEEGNGVPHLSGRQAGERARGSGARRLVLTHFAPGVDPETQRQDAERAFDGPVELATPAATFTL